MKLNPGDIIIDKNFNRVLTVLDVKRMTYINYGNCHMEYDMIHYMDSSQPQGIVQKVFEYELDSWVNVELLRANKK